MVKGIKLNEELDENDEHDEEDDISELSENARSLQTWIKDWLRDQARYVLSIEFYRPEIECNSFRGVVI